ncbi:receptor tyrosine-protein kinase erbB-3a [Eucyclogobius newberryi]|uniref:receptor tyrosine-protein kinase erbB-3a n=1 Tax=Eucyclogobius newberryi TaxID=166745 RepID=UPI003B595A28
MRTLLVLCGVLALLSCALTQLSNAQTQRVCMGTQNGLSTTGKSDIQFNMMKERYSGCEIVMGNLEITMMEHYRDFSFLQSIREVTGYILLALNEFSRLPLEQLRVIRGSTLYEGQYALAVMVNYQKDGHRGLQELGLTHLTEILEGGVNIFQNEYLSYAQNVNWLDIVKDGSAHIMIQDNGPEKPCHEACGVGVCWGPESDKCQILTKTVCAPQCNGRCFGRSPSECCHNECAGGCTGPLDTDCFACRRFNNLGSCVRECPQALLYNKNTFRMEDNPNVKYQYGSICVSQCPTNLVVDGSSCVVSCPPGTMEVEKNSMKRCQPCAGLCPKACDGTGTSDRQTVDAVNIDSFINCTKIQGSLHFLVTGIKGDDFNKVPPLDPEKLKIFNTVREITDILSIQSWPENMSDLSVFSNLETIEGRSLNKPMGSKRSFSLMVMKIPSLTALGLRSLRRINDGSVYISGNKKLCYHHTMNWGKIFSSNVKKRLKQIDIKDNCPLETCAVGGHVCDPLCSDGCWGPGPDQCVSCRNYSRGGTCVSDCMFFSGEQREFASASGECLPCHSECKVQEGKETCLGPGADQCVSCANFGDGPHCVPSCPQGLMAGEGVIFKYPNKAGSCEPCHSNCTQGCSGPGLKECIGIASVNITAIVLGVIALLFVGFSIFMLTVLYRRGLAIRRKRAMRRYMENGERFEQLDSGEKGPKVCARILKPSELRKIKPLGNGVFGTVHKGVWIPEGDTVKLPVAIKTIHDRTGRQTFSELTDHMMVMGSLDHINVVRILGICPGASLQLVTQLSSQGSMLEHVRKHKNKLTPQRLLNWCVQIAKGMYYLEENRMVHRNLAARNVLLQNNYTVQISDYGVADLLYPDDKKYYNEAKAPIKWMALESILFRRYTHQSDVWSYGVTIWEMMSYGVEPYTNMRPQEVPDLLEKGERLSQPQICTIDVYMVMVKCWMIDENIRPTFKELASEFTRMARDPPRYLVIKEDCRQPDSTLDEQAQRSVDLDELEELDCALDSEEDLDRLSVPQYLPPSRSLSHLLRMDSHRVLIPAAGETGYLPMTPGVETNGQSLFQSRSRLDSTRTVSESSEGCGAAVELQSEEVSGGGSLTQRRHREDSAYMSQRDSLSGGPPETPSPELEEEDHNGYVLPRDSPEKDTLLSPPRGLSLKSIRNYPSAPLLDDPDNAEYEYMNRQRSPASTRNSSQRSKTSGNKKRTSSLSSYATTSSGDITPTPELQGFFNGPDLDQFGASEVQYEYMDIRGNGDATPAPDPPPPSPKIDLDEEDYDEDYHYTNRQPKLHQALQDRNQLRIQGTEEEQYEDMDSYAVMRRGEAVVYQNLGREEGNSEGHRSGFDAYVKVRAGVGIGDASSVDRSFDNPDYWHSRTYMKSNAVPT